MRTLFFLVQRMRVPNGVKKTPTCLSLALILSACEPPLTVDDCDRLLMHYTETQIDQARPSASKRERAQLTRAARTKAELDPEFARCGQRVSRTQFECAMQAHSADQIERCLL